MKNIFLPFILGLFLLSSCASETIVSPEIKVISCSVNDTIVAETPKVKVGDVVELSLNLIGNGSDLFSFHAKANGDEVKISLAEYDQKNVTDERNFTDAEACRLTFIDGVSTSNVKVKATVQAVKEDVMTLKFYLSAKTECEGSELDVDLQKK